MRGHAAKCRGQNEEVLPIVKLEDMLKSVEDRMNRYN
jgi:hypothetical protein